MAGYDETVISEAVQRMAVEEGSGAVGRLKGKGFAKEIVFVVSEPLEVEKVLAAMIDKVRKLVIDKVKHFAEGTKFRIIYEDGIQTSNAPVETGKAAAAIDEIQTENIEKLPVEAGQAVEVLDKIQTGKMDKALLEDEKNQFCTMTSEAPVETGKEAVAIETGRFIESHTPPGKYRLYADDDYVRTILAMPRELPRVIPFSRGNNIAELLGVTEEALEEERQVHREAAARAERISNEFALFQEKVREESDHLGYFEVDDEYLDGVATMKEYSEELWKSKDRSGFQFFDPEEADELCCVK